MRRIGKIVSLLVVGAIGVAGVIGDERSIGGRRRV